MLRSDLRRTCNDMVGVQSTDKVECLGLVGHADVDRVAAVVACQANVCQPEQGKLRGAGMSAQM